MQRDVTSGSAYNTSILGMSAVLVSDSTLGTIQEIALLTIAHHTLKMNRPCSRTKIPAHSRLDGIREAELLACHLGSLQSPRAITNRAPLIVQKDLYSAFASQVASNQTQSSLININGRKLQEPFHLKIITTNFKTCKDVQATEGTIWSHKNGNRAANELFKNLM